ncbi:PIR protein [Plasmodium vivax]|uniref:VIR protein n=1 Tax=Plasmodium vivax TaxID=5855 RepID=A0A565A3N2_PLAVI|nr:PIR protein [Plasmodium vivax]
MSEYITDYSFLKEIWKVYDEFDNTVEGDAHYYKYEGVCQPIVNNYGDEQANDKNFCMKLVRNLGYHYSDPKYYKPNRDRCHILYNWIYNKKNNYKNPNEIITNCFDDYIKIMRHVKANNICSYDLYKSVYEDPMKMTILDIFNDNVKNIKTILMDKYDTGEFSPQNFVCEFVKIYKNIHNTYCATTDQREGKAKITCEKLKELKITYDNYLLRDEVIKNKIPSLDNDNEYSNKCKSKTKELKAVTLNPGGVETFPQSREDSGRNIGSFTPSAQDPDENTGGSMSRTVSTALGTVAGASSILTLLYKFTPGRNWIHSGIRGSRGRINSNIYSEEPNQLLFNGMEHNDFNSYNIGYEAI